MPEKLDRSLVLVRERIEKGMRGSADLILDEFQIAGVKGLAFMFDGLVSNSQVSDFLLRPLSRIQPSEITPEGLWDILQREFLFSSEQGVVDNYDDLFTRAMSGFVLVLLDGVPKALSLGYQGFVTRSAGEPAMEKNLRGSREGFTESNNTNTAMVRRRLKSPCLTVETLCLGRQSRTNVRLVYLSDAAEKETVDTVRQRLQSAGLSLVLDSAFLQAFFGKGAASLFTGTGMTQRPDTLCAKLTEGRVGVMVDGSPNVMIVPYLFTEHFHTLDDYTQRPYFTAFVRALRLGAVSAFAVPSLYEPVTVLRFLFIIIGGGLGLYGMVLGILLLAVNLCSLHTLGTPLTAPVAPWQRGALRDLFWRSGWRLLGRRDYRISSARQKGEQDAD